MTDKQYNQALEFENRQLKKRATLASIYMAQAEEALRGIRHGGDTEALACIDDAQWELKRILCDHNNLVEVREGEWWCPDCNPHKYSDGMVEAVVL